MSKEKKNELIEESVEETEDLISGTNPKKPRKNVGMSVMISIMIVFALCIAFLVAASAMGLFKGDGTVFDMETWKKERAKQQGSTTQMQESQQNTEKAGTLAEAVFDNANVFDSDSQKEVPFEESKKEFTIGRYALVDFDGDGKKDLVLELTDGADGTMQVLLEKGNGVFAKKFPYRGMSSISVNGIFTGSNGADDSFYSKLIFGDDGTISAQNIAKEEDSTFWIQIGDAKDLTEVSREEHLRFVNRTFGTLVVGFKEYSEDELKKDLENPEGFNEVAEADFGETYWSVIIPELPQYNDLIGSSYAAFAKKEKDVYESGSKWEKETKELFCVAENAEASYVGTDNSIYSAEYIGYIEAEDRIVMSGAAMDENEYTGLDFLVDGQASPSPAVFCVKEANGSDKGTDALVWSCADVYLIFFVTGDSRDMAFYDRPVKTVCYIMKDYSGVKGLPQVLETSGAGTVD